MISLFNFSLTIYYFFRAFDLKIKYGFLQYVCAVVRMRGTGLYKQLIRYGQQLQYTDKHFFYRLLLFKIGFPIMQNRNKR